MIVLQHLLEDTEELLNLLIGAGAEVFAVIAKPYSVDSMVWERVSRKCSIVQKSYTHLEGSDFLDTLIGEAVHQCKLDGRKLIILDVGGWFALPLVRLQDEYVDYIAGVVEDTSFGHYRYQKHINAIKIPVFSVARSHLKEIEAHAVGEAAVSAMIQIFRELGISISGRKALVVGYGMIGKNVAASLRVHNLTVSVYDKNDHRNLSAFMHGFNIHTKEELLKGADIIFSATGEQAITLSDIEMCKDSVILVSVGSKDTEFDVQGLKRVATNRVIINSHITSYTLPQSRKVVVVRDGTAINFSIKSVPTEIIDLVFAEIVVCSLLLLEGANVWETGVIQTTPLPHLNAIARDWLGFVNP